MSAPDELRALVQRYARAVDDRDIPRLESLFHPDATIDGVRGPVSAREFVETMRAPRTFPTSMHVLGEPLIEVDADGHAARLDTYGVVYQIGDRATGQSDLTLGVRYLDTVEWFEERWVIRVRVARTVWMR